MALTTQSLPPHEETQYISQVFQFTPRRSIFEQVREYSHIVLPTIGLLGSFLWAVQPAPVLNTAVITLLAAGGLYLGSSCLHHTESEEELSPEEMVPLPPLREEVKKPLERAFLSAQEPLSRPFTGEPTLNVKLIRSFKGMRQHVISQQIHEVYLPCEERCGPAASLIFEYYFDRWPNLEVSIHEGRHTLVPSPHPLPRAVEKKFLNSISFDPSYRNAYTPQINVSLTLTPKWNDHRLPNHHNYRIMDETNQQVLGDVLLSENPDDSMIIKNVRTNQLHPIDEKLLVCAKKRGRLYENSLVLSNNPPPSSTIS